MSHREQILLLGEDYPDYRVVESRTQRACASAAALTVGSDPLSPSRIHKVRADVPNEDGLLLVDEDARTLLAVADGHHGHEASHHLLRHLADVTRQRVPRNPLELLTAIRDCADDSPDAEYPAASSLLVAIWDRESGRGFGTSFGDSTLTVIRGAENAENAASWDECAANVRNTEFVSPRFADSLDPRRALEFVFRADPGDVVVAFTDGVDGCHYGFPETSVTPSHLRALWVAAQGDVETFVSSTVELALSGVDSNPGGQDNIALAATEV